VPPALADGAAAAVGTADFHLVQIHLVAEVAQDFARKGAIHMINLLKFRTRAQYQEGEVENGDVSGREAYLRYGTAVGRIIVFASEHKQFGSVLWAIPLPRLWKYLDATDKVFTIGSICSRHKVARAFTTSLVPADQLLPRSIIERDL